MKDEIDKKEKCYGVRKENDDDDEQEEQEEQEEEEDKEENVEEELFNCLCYLREKYHYCFYCGIKFDDEADMLNSCPGLSETDH